MQLTTFLCNCHSTKNPESVDIARILDSWILKKKIGVLGFGGPINRIKLVINNS